MIKFQGIGAQGNYSQAGRAVADDTLRAFLAARRNSPNYGEMAITAADIRKTEKLATLKNQAEVAATRLTVDADVKAKKMQIDSASKLKTSQRKAGALAVAGQMATDAGALFGKEKAKRRELDVDDAYYNKRTASIHDRMDELNDRMKGWESELELGDNLDLDESVSSLKTGSSLLPSAGSGINLEPYTLTKAQVKDYALAAGFTPSEASTVVGIAGGESRRDPTNNTKRSGLFKEQGEDSVGLMQINWGFHKDRGWLQNLGITSREQLLDPATNMKAAKYLYDGSGNFSDWTVFNEGIYKGWL